MRQRIETEQDPGDDAEIAAAAPNRPEEIRLVLRVHLPNPPVGGDHLCREHRIDRHPELAREISDPAPEGDAPDAHGPRVAEADCEAILRQRLGYLERRRSRLDP